jgi:hypothetical protein
MPQRRRSLHDPVNLSVDDPRCREIHVIMDEVNDQAATVYIINIGIIA